uniref:Transposase n=1 Tax=Bradyrhizobium barranii subsp. barranii TaxID=2823807 RepID=A0A7Z0TKE6_9BRAD
MTKADRIQKQIIAVSKAHEAGAKTADLARKHGVSEATIYNWKASSQWLARKIAAMGHTVRIIPAQFVKPYGAPRRRVLPVEEGSTQRVVD